MKLRKATKSNAAVLEHNFKSGQRFAAWQYDDCLCLEVNNSTMIVLRRAQAEKLADFIMKGKRK